MKTNLPVTGHEVRLQDDSVITSATDLKGRIRYVNREFIEVSGFAEEELLGKSQNIVRHPDMPPAAFADLWQTIQAGRPWMGIVKNRCKNGDHYWVDSYVTPLLNNGEVTGYESTRVLAAEKVRQRAEKLYQSIWSEKRNWLGGLHKLGLIQRMAIAVVLLPAILVSLLYSLRVLDLQSMLSVFVAAGLAGLIVVLLGRPLARAVRETKSIVDNPLMQYVYTGRYDEVGQLQMVLKLSQARTRTGFKRVEQATDKLTQQAGNMVEMLEASNGEIQQQQAMTEQMAAAINEMTASVSEVAGNAKSAAQATHSATEQSRTGALTVTEAIGIIESLSSYIMTAEKDIQQLSKDSETIGEVLGVIKGIAEQTNLLALNAAIEAARAGEQGRGFAVVADEVRTLASRTQESTVKIQQIIEKLQQGVGTAVNQMSNVRARAGECVEQVEISAEALAEISGAIQIINDMNTQIATAANQQTRVVDEINTSIQAVNMNAQNTASTIDRAASTGHDLANQASDLRTLIHQLGERA